MAINPSVPDQLSAGDSEPERFEKLRRELLTSESASERAAAARKLGSLANKASGDCLIAALYDDSAEVRSAAVESLRLIGDVTALGPLEDLQEREDNSLTKPLIVNAIRAITKRQKSLETQTSAAPTVRGEKKVGSGASGHTQEPTGRQRMRELESHSEIHPVVKSRKQPDRTGAQLTGALQESLTSLQTESLNVEQQAERLAHLEAVREQLKAEAQQNQKTEKRLNTQIATLRNEAAKQLPLLEEARREVAALESRKQAFTLEAEKLKGEVEAFDASVVELERMREQFDQRRQAEAEARRAVVEADRSRLKAEVERRTREEQQLREEIEVLRRIEAEQLERIEQAKIELAAQQAAVAKVEIEAQGEVVVAEVVSEAPEEIAPVSVVETETFTFDLAQQVAGTDKPAFDYHQFEATASPMAPDVITSERHEDESGDKALSLVTLETGLTTVNHESTPISQAAARLQSPDPAERCEALMDLSQLGRPECFDLIADRFDDSSAQVRNAAVRALCELNVDRAASLTRALREAQPARRRRIGAALAGSGLASQALNCLAGESREVTYDAFTILFLMAKAGEVQSLIETIERHSDLSLRLAVIKLLAFSNQSDVITAFRRLAVRASLPAEVRSAVMEAIHDMGNSARQLKSSAA